MAKKVSGLSRPTQITSPSPAEALNKRKSTKNIAAGLDKMSSSQQPFTKINYLLMGGCCLMIVIGFLLMLGGGSSVEGGFNPDIFSTRRIVVGPAIAFLGFLLLAFAILVDPKKKIKKQSENSTEVKDGMD